ncbi:uncharacterized protein VTP21DRAFT_10118 [Calcarisporiella thermophila]|uniref:uncharacterized protein n=1 Tax=Calcarisporiella thermophila TaxID=911321 RepID=UPI003743D247
MLRIIPLAHSARPMCSHSKLTVITMSKRNAHDLMIRKKTGKPIVSSGAGGRSSVSGHVATVFGCTGFLGRYVTHKLAKIGTQVITPYRDEEAQRPLKVMGDLGQVVKMEFDLRNREQLVECIRHSDIVYNIIGRDYETKNFSFDDVHVEGARAIAEICREVGTPRLVHVSALNADENSPSKFLRSKALGEKVVKEIVPDATIVRPATMYGYDDRFLNRMGSRRGTQFLLNEGKTRLRPVHVLDVAEAMFIMLNAESTIGKTFELYGSQEYTYKQIWDLIADLSKRQPKEVHIPVPLAKAVATVLDKLPWPVLSPDQITRALISDEPSANAHTFADLLIEPHRLEDVAIQFVRRFRSSNYFDQPLEKGDGEVKKGVYHVVN